MSTTALADAPIRKSFNPAPGDRVRLYPNFFPDRRGVVVAVRPVDDLGRVTVEVAETRETIVCHDCDLEKVAA
ncbi:MAG: hypothetical protein V4819_19330 [Verrucomicrobiota bacterium]